MKPVNLPVRLVLAAASAALASLAACTGDPGPSGVNLLKNGGFESDSAYAWRHLTSRTGADALPGWTLLDGGVEHLRPAVGGGQVPASEAPEGDFILDLAPTTHRGGGIRQAFATTKGAEYVLEFRAGTLRALGREGTGTIEVWIDGKALDTLEVSNPDQTAIQWQAMSARFRAEGEVTTLDLRNSQDPVKHFAFVDDVHVADGD